MTDIKQYLALFPGQGSQKVGMGKELNETSPEAADIFARADAALGFSLSKLCFEGPEEKLTETAVAQPAILTVSTILNRLAQPALGAGHQPVAAAGHSLGEYSALVAAGAIEFEKAVVLVNKRGTYMQEAVPAGVGAMYAVLGKELSEIEEALSKVTSGVAEVANINAPGQIVVAGHKEALQEFREILAGARVVELAVSAPFHCSLMKPAQDRLARDLADLEIRPAAFPVYANFTSQPVTSPEDIRKTLTSQVCGRVRWLESMQNAIEFTKIGLAIEFGHGNVLSGMLKRINPEVARKNVDSIESARQV